MKYLRRNLGITIGLLTSFVLWTVLISFIDVGTIGPQGSSVGFSRINRFFHSLTGVNFNLYVITDYLSIIPFGVCTGFGALGVLQWIKRKSISKVDHDVLALGGFYVVTVVVYMFFEFFTVNFRPALIEGVLEASYPSSTTMLVLCVMVTAIIQFNRRIKNRLLRNIVIATCTVFTVFMVIGRVLSGVHWITDIIGGALLSAGLIMGYYSSIELICQLDHSKSKN